MEPTSLQKIDKADALKTEGNNFFKAKEYVNALRKYHQANIYVQGLVEAGSQYDFQGNPFKLPPDQVQRVRDLKYSLFMNMAQIYLFDKKFLKAKDILIRAAEIQTTAKLLFRRACALMNLAEFEQAKKDFSQSVKLDPSVGEDVNQKLKELQSLEKTYQKQLADRYKKMFA